MRILYDTAGLQECVGGVSRYFVELTKHLPPDIDPVFSTVETNNVYLRALGVPAEQYAFSNFLPKLRFPVKYRIYRWASRWFHSVVRGPEETNLRAFKRKLEEGSWNLVHLTAPHQFGRELNWVKKVGVPYVITVHDLIPEFFKGLTELRSGKRLAWREKALTNAAAIIAVSENTKNDIVKIYGVDPERITVIYHGQDKTSQTGGANALNLPEDYVLFVGKRGGYKNYDWLEKVVEPLEKDGVEFIATGGEKRYTDEELRELYRRARCFIYPSKYEGFGIPILEAWREGCPVILSNSSCFPEIGGDAALYFELGDAEGLRRQILELGSVLEGTPKRHHLIARGLERLKDFTWDKAGLKTAGVYRRVAR